MSGKSGSPERIFLIRFRRISSLTGSVRYPLASSSPSVLGRSVTIAALPGVDRSFALFCLQLMLDSPPDGVNATGPQGHPDEGFTAEGAKGAEGRGDKQGSRIV